MGRIGRGSSANTFIDAKLEVSEELNIPISALEGQTSGAIALGPNGKLIQVDQEGEVQEYVTSVDIDGLVKKSDLSPLFPVSYTKPTVTLSSTQSSLGLEIGQVINIPIVHTFNKNDGGDGTLVSAPETVNGVIQNVVMTTTPKTYKVTYSYAQGPVKTNSLGDYNPIGRIEAGQVDSNTLSYRGYYIIPFGAAATLPSNSTEARAVATKRLSSDASTFILNTGTEFTMQFIYLSPDKNTIKVIDLDALNLDITNQYVLENANASVNNIAGSQVTGYKLFVRRSTVPYTQNHRHQITIS